MAYESAAMEIGEERPGFRFPFAKAGKALAFVATVSGATLALEHSRTFIRPASVADAEQLNQMLAPGPRKTCSPPWTEKSRPDNVTENCLNTGCCTITGYNCFQKEEGVAGCLNGCDATKGWDCSQPQGAIRLVDAKEGVSEKSFYCFAVYTQDNGNPTKHPGAEEELALLRAQAEQKVGVFACPGQDVFSDVTVNIPGYGDTIQVNDDLKEFHLVKRKKTKTWVNTGMFKQVWKKIGEIGRWTSYEWVIKLDADAVFIPARLETFLKNQPVSYSGIYVENCVEVKDGFFGNIELLSHTAFEKLLSNIDSCSETIEWASLHATPWGPIGEDLFAQRCMDKQGVTKVQNFDLTTDGACPGIKKKWGISMKTPKPMKPQCEHVVSPVMHPFKTVDEWFDCYHKTLSTGV